MRRGAAVVPATTASRVHGRGAGVGSPVEWQSESAFRNGASSASAATGLSAATGAISPQSSCHASPSSGKALSHASGSASAAAASIRHAARSCLERGGSGQAQGRLRAGASRGQGRAASLAEREPQRVQALLREGGQGEPAHAGSKRRRSPPPRWLRAVGRLRAGPPRHTSAA